MARVASLADLRVSLGNGLLRSYLVLGPSPMVDRARALIEAAVLPRAGPPSFNVDRVRTSDDRPDRVFDATRQLPMMGEVRYVELRGVQDASADLGRALLAYLANPSPSTVFLASGSFMPRSAPVAKAREAMGDQGLHVDLTDTHPGGFVVAVARLLGAAIDPLVAGRVVDVAGKDIAVLEQEVGKLVTYAGSDPITVEMVDEVVSQLAEPVVWALANGILDRDVAGTMEALVQLGADPGERDRLLGSVAKVVRDQLAEDERRRGTRDPAAELRRVADAGRAGHDSAGIHALHSLVLDLVTDTTRS